MLAFYPDFSPLSSLFEFQCPRLLPSFLFQMTPRIKPFRPPSPLHSFSQRKPEMLISRLVDFWMVLLLVLDFPLPSPPPLFFVFPEDFFCACPELV